MTNRCPYQSQCYDSGTESCPTRPTDCEHFRAIVDYNVDRIVNFMNDEGMFQIINSGGKTNE